MDYLRKALHDFHFVSENYYIEMDTIKVSDIF